MSVQLHNPISSSLFWVTLLASGAFGFQVPGLLTSQIPLIYKNLESLQRYSREKLGLGVGGMNPNSTTY